MAAIFDLLVITLSESVHTSRAVLPNTKNVCLAFGISLLSCILTGLAAAVLHLGFPLESISTVGNRIYSRFH